MQSEIVSLHFNNEFFVLHPNYTKEQIIGEFLDKCPRLFNYDFKNTELLFNAFIHKSFAHEVKIELTPNEKLEFLGDSVLQLIISEVLYERFSDLNEGELSKLRSTIVNEQILAKIGRFYQINKLILLGKGEVKSQGFDKDSIIADTLEAIIGAIYLDGQYSLTKNIVLSLFEDFENKTKTKIFANENLLHFDAKSRLQEMVMAKYKSMPIYESKDLSNQKYEVKLIIEGKTVETLVHNSKKKAMQILAKNILDKEIL